MSEFYFKAYISGGREYFEYSDDLHDGEVKKAGFLFPESLLAILDLDLKELAAICHKDDHCAFDMQDALDALARTHIYFELLRLNWSARIEGEYHWDGQSPFTRPIHHDSFRHIVTDIQDAQKKITRLFTEVLDIDLNTRNPDVARLPVSERIAAYANSHCGEPLYAFQFRPLSLGFEQVDSNCVAEVLYPRSFNDLIEYFMRECLKRDQRMRVCKNCGRWFAITGRSSAEYCSRVIDNKGRTCKDVGSIAQWTRNRITDEVFKVYRREYKRRFAWIKAGTIPAEDFYRWSEEARAQKKKCDAGEISLEEFRRWLAQD